MAGNWIFGIRLTAKSILNLTYVPHLIWFVSTKNKNLFRYLGQRQGHVYIKKCNQLLAKISSQ